VYRWSIVAAVAAEQDGVLRADQALRAGFARHEIASLCRSGRRRRLARGHYLVRPSATNDRTSRIRAAVSAAGPKACAVLGSAAELHGIAGLRRSDVLHVSVPEARIQRVDGHVVVHQFVPCQADVTCVDGIPTTTVSRTLADVVLRASRFEAVSALDSALNSKLITDEDFAELPGRLRRRPGAVRARAWLREVDGRARSPPETRSRLRCVDGGVPPDQVGYLVRDECG